LNTGKHSGGRAIRLAGKMKEQLQKLRQTGSSGKIFILLDNYNI
jgi:hypothetical protein